MLSASGKRSEEEIAGRKTAVPEGNVGIRPRLSSGISRSLFQIGLSPGWKCPLTNPGDLVVPPREDKSEATTREFGTPFPDFPSLAGHR